MSLLEIAAHRQGVQQLQSPTLLRSLFTLSLPATGTATHTAALHLSRVSYGLAGDWRKRISLGNLVAAERAA